MTVNSINESTFDWKAYEANQLKLRDPFFFDNSTRMRFIASAMLASAAALAVHAVRAKLAFTPTILTLSAVGIISLLAVHIFLNRYTDQNVHHYSSRLKGLINEYVPKHIGLIKFLEKERIFDHEKKVVWDHFKHHELTLTYKEIIERNGKKIADFLTDSEKKALGVKFLAETLNESTDPSTLDQILDTAKTLLVLDSVPQSPFFKLILSKRLTETDFPGNQLLLSFLRGNLLINSAANIVYHNTCQKLAEAQDRFDRENKVLNARSANVLTAHNEKERTAKRESAKHNAIVTAQKAVISNFEQQKSALEAVLIKAQAQLIQLKQQLDLYEKQFANREQYIANYVPQSPTAILSLERIQSEYNSLTELRNEIYNLEQQYPQTANQQLHPSLVQARKQYIKRFTQYCAWKKTYDVAGEEGRRAIDLGVGPAQKKIEAEAIESYTSLEASIAKIKAEILAQQLNEQQRAAELVDLKSKITEKLAANETLEAEHKKKMTDFWQEAEAEGFAKHKEILGDSLANRQTFEEEQALAYSYFKEHIHEALFTNDNK